MLITESVLRKICPRVNSAHAAQLVPLINAICPLYGIKTADIFHEFFANLCEESGEFTRYEENLNYSPKRLMQVWPSRFKTFAQAQLYAFNPRSLAMKVYGNRADLGNLTAVDGFTFRGSGPIQITGRGNVTRFAEWMRKAFNVNKTPEQWAELLRTNEEFGLHSACWIFAIAKQLIDEAIDDKMITIIKRINGGLTNLSSRLRYYELTKKYIV